MDLNLESDWKEVLKEELTLPYFRLLEEKVKVEFESTTVYPEFKNIFSAFNLCSFANTKVVILGQDPYHGADQAQGLSFSVPDGQKIPPSLRNIYKEIKSDLGKDIPTSGNLERWAEQGVLLLNTTLTVKAGTPGSHQGLGWETFTDAVIKKISDEKEHVVFLLWGKFAISKEVLVDQSKHLVLTAPHPSPFSAHTGFIGSKHFSKTNQYLKNNGIKEIEW